MREINTVHCPNASPIYENGWWLDTTIPDNTPEDSVCPYMRTRHDITLDEEASDEEALNEEVLQLTSLIINSSDMDSEELVGTSLPPSPPDSPLLHSDLEMNSQVGHRKPDTSRDILPTSDLCAKPNLSDCSDCEISPRLNERVMGNTLGHSPAWLTQGAL